MMVAWMGWLVMIDDDREENETNGIFRFQREPDQVVRGRSLFLYKFAGR
jgi:hypothetical protein